jgi:hypothetical protein
MESYDINTTVLALPIAIGVAFLLYKIYSEFKTKNSTIHTALSSSSQSQDFSSFKPDSDKFNSTIHDEIEDEVNVDNDSSEVETTKGGLSKLEDFVNKLLVLPKDSLDDIQISKMGAEDLFLSVEVNEELGLTLDTFYPEEISIDYTTWSSRLKDIIWEYKLELEEVNEDKDKYFTIILAGKTAIECAEIIKQIINNAYVDYSGINLLVEFNHY